MTTAAAIKIDNDRLEDVGAEITFVRPGSKIAQTGFGYMIDSEGMIVVVMIYDEDKIELVHPSEVEKITYEDQD